MAEKIELELELDNNVSGPAKEAADSLRKVQDATTKAQKKLDTDFANAWVKIGRAAQTAQWKQEAAMKAASPTSRLHEVEKKMKALQANPDAYKKLFAAQRELVEQQKKLGKAGWAAQGAEEFGHKLKSAVGAIAIAELMMKGVETVVDFLKEGVKMAFEEGSKSEQMRLSYKYLPNGKGAMEDQERFSKQTNYSPMQIAAMSRPLLQAGLTQQQSRTAFAASSDLNAKGLGSTEEYLDMFAKIKRKGGISEKQLTGMQINNKDFYETLGKKLGTSASTAKEKAAKGELNPDLLIAEIENAIKKSQGGAELGSVGEELSKTMGGRLKKLSELPENYLEKMSKSPEWTKLSDKIGEVLEGLDPDSPKGQKIMGALFATFDKLAAFVEKALTPENIDKFGDGIASAVEMLQKIPDILNTVVTILEVLGTVVAGITIVKGIQGMVSGFQTLSTLAGTMLGSLTAVVAAATAGYELGKKIDEKFHLSDDIAKGAGLLFGQEDANTAAGFSYGSGNNSTENPMYKLGIPASRSGNRTSNVTVGSINTTVYPAKDDTKHTSGAVTGAISGAVRGSNLERAGAEIGQ